MNHDDDYYDEIHRFLLGEMTDAEATAFQARIDADADLAEAVRLEEELQLLVQYQRKAELKQMLRDTPTNAEDESDEDDLHAKPEQPTAPRSSPPTAGGIRPPYWKYVMYASGLAAILIAAVMLFKGNREFDPDAAVQRYLAENSYQIANQMRDDAPESRPGFLAYSKSDWSTAYAQLDTSGAMSEALLMHGVSAMHIERWDQARRDFSRLEGDSTPRYAGNAIWFLALLDLQARNYAVCKHRLNQLVNTKGYHWKEAQSLLSELPVE